MKVKLYIYMELTTVYYDSAPYVLIGVGCVILVVGSLGCLCTFKGLAALLYVVSFFHFHSFILLFLQCFDTVGWVI